MTAILERPVQTDPVFTVDRGGFAEAAAAVARAIPSRPSAPIMAGARLAVAGDTLTLAGYDYETSTEVTVACDGVTDGSVVVSGALLASIAKALPKKPVSVSVAGPLATVSCGSARFTLPTMSTDDYPDLPVVPPVSGSVDGRVFADAVDAVKAAVGADDALPMLTGIHVSFERDRIEFAATDRFRLAICTVEWECAGEPPAPILIPGKSFVEAARSVDNGVVDLAVGDGVLGVSHGLTSSTMRLMDAEFPAFRKLLPDHHARVAEVDVQELALAVKRASLVAERGTSVRLAFDDDGLTVACGDGGSASVETVAAHLAGEPVEIGFNPGYLLDALATIGSERALVGMVDSRRPAVLAPNRGGIPAGVPGEFGRVFDERLHLLMPVRLPG